jgi:hypothetical protein
LAETPTALEKFFNVVDEQAIESWFFQQRINEKTFEVRVQEGSYRIDTQYFSKGGSEIGGPEIENYSMSWITADGEAPVQMQTPFGSYPLTVDRDRSVTIAIDPVITEQ